MREAARLRGSRPLGSGSAGCARLRVVGGARQARGLRPPMRHPHRMAQNRRAGDTSHGRWRSRRRDVKARSRSPGRHWAGQGRHVRGVLNARYAFEVAVVIVAFLVRRHTGTTTGGSTTSRCDADTTVRCTVTRPRLSVLDTSASRRSASQTDQHSRALTLRDGERTGSPPTTIAPPAVTCNGAPRLAQRPDLNVNVTTHTIRHSGDTPGPPQPRWHPTRISTQGHVPMHDDSDERHDMDTDGDRGRTAPPSNTASTHRHHGPPFGTGRPFGEPGDMRRRPHIAPTTQVRSPWPNRTRYRPTAHRPCRTSRATTDQSSTRTHRPPRTPRTTATSADGRHTRHRESPHRYTIRPDEPTATRGCLGTPRELRRGVTRHPLPGLNVQVRGRFRRRAS